MLLDRSIICPVLIGRARPLASSVGVLEHARGGAGAALLVSGEAGVGKSRLLRASVEQARAQGFLVLQGASFQADQALPFAPLLDLVRGFAASASPAVAAHALAPAAAELLALFPELAWVLTDAQPAPPTDPEHGRRRLFHALLLALQLLARRQPILLVIEDVHWSDDATLDLLAYIAHGLADNRIVLALSYRSDEVGPRLRRLLTELDRTRLGIEVELSRLRQDEVAAMLRAIFGEDSAPAEEFIALLHDLTDGNPFFVEEVLKALIVAGDLAPASDGRWRARPLERLHVPRSATEAVRRRLSELTAPAREVASLAAVAGRRFDFALLHAISGKDEQTLLGLVKELVDAQIVVDESADRLAFRHALTREALYAELLVRERVKLHRQVASAIEQLSASAPDSVTEALAYHTFEAGDWTRAREYATRAAAHAFALHAPREALAHLNRAVAATEHEKVSIDSALLLARGRAHETLGDFDAAHADFYNVLNTAHAAGEREMEWRALHALGMLWAARSYTRAGQYRNEALALARADGDAARIARSLNRVGNWHLNLEQPSAALRHHEEALTLLEELQDEGGVAETLDLIAMAHHIAGRQVEAIAQYERVLALFAGLGNRRGSAWAQLVLAVCGPSHHSSPAPFGWSELQAEIIATERPVVEAQEIGWRAGEAGCRFLLADCLLWRGAYDRALPLALGALAIAEELNHLEWQAGAARVLGVAALDLFALDRARDLLGRSHEIALRLGSRTWTRWTAAPFAVALARAGEYSQALAVLDAASADSLGHEALRRVDAAPTLGERHMQIARAEVLLAAGDATAALDIVEASAQEQGRSLSTTHADDVVAARSALPRHALLRGQALLGLGMLDDAAVALKVACAHAEATFAAPLLWRAQASLGHVHRLRRSRLDARACFDRARSIAHELAGRIPDPSLRETFERGVDDAAPAPARPSARQSAKAAYSGLTRRQREVAQLVAEGKSNRSIAHALGIAERTVEDHVADALAKLNFSSRAQLAAWVVQIALLASE